MGRDRDGFDVMLAYRGAPDSATVSPLVALGVTDLITAPWMVAARDAPGRRVMHDLVLRTIDQLGSDVIDGTG